MKLNKTEEAELLDDSDEVETDAEELGGDLATSDDMLGDWGDYGEGVQPMEKHAELLKKLMTFDPYLKTKFEKWVNIRWDQDKEAYIKNEYGYPVMNIRGASWCISFIDTYARDNNMITHVGLDDYNWFREDLIYAIFPKIYCSYKDFGISDVGDCYRVAIEVLHTALLVLMGSGDGKAARILTETTHRQESLTISPQQQQPYIGQAMPPPPKTKGFFGKLRKMFGGMA